MKFQVILFSIFIQNVASAGIFKQVTRYLHIPTARVVSVKEINQKEGTATLWQPFKEVVKISDLSIELDEGLNEVQSQEMILVNTGSSFLRACAANYVFENGIVNFSCLEGWHRHDWGRDPIYTHWNIQSELVIPEVSSLNGFDKKSCAILKSSVMDLEAEEKVRVDVIFKNGEVLIRKMGVNLLHTDPPIINPFIRRSHISNLVKCPEASVDNLRN